MTWPHHSRFDPDQKACAGAPSAGVAAGFQRVHSADEKERIASGVRDALNLEKPDKFSSVANDETTQG
jgi:hypothetical protein